MKKSLMSIILAVVTAVGIPTTTAFAAEPTPTRNIPVSVDGTVEATTLDITLPIKATFVINAARDFVSPYFEIVNNSPIPVTVVATSMKAKSDTPAKVVSPEQYTDEEWDNLNFSTTRTRIAFGMMLRTSAKDLEDLVQPAATETKWFGPESEDSNLRLGVIKSAYGKEASPKMTVGFESKYGKSWGDITALPYQLTLTVSAY